MKKYGSKIRSSQSSSSVKEKPQELTQKEGTSLCNTCTAISICTRCTEGICAVCVHTQ